MSLFPRAFAAGEMEPIVDPGQQLLVVDREGYNLYRAAFIEPLPYSRALVVDLITGTVATGAAGAQVSMTNLLDMQDNQAGQFRMEVLDDIDVLVSQPQSVARYSTRNVSSPVSMFSKLRDRCAHTTETFILGQDRTYMTPTNNGGRGITLGRVAFWGFKYVLVGKSGLPTTGALDPIKTFGSIDEALRSGEKFTVLPAGGWGR